MPAAVFIAAAGVVAGPPAVLISNAVSVGSPVAVPHGGIAFDDPSSAALGVPSSSPSVPRVRAPAAGPGAPPRQLIVPELFVIAPHQLSAAQVTGIGRLPGVRAVLAVDGAQLHINGQTATVLGVPPAAFRSWTPPATAVATGIWAALENGGLVPTYDAATRLGLTLGGSYQVSGTPMTLTAIAPSGVPGADAIVDSQRSAQLGLIRDVAALVSAPGADYAALVQRIHAIVGSQARVVNLVPVQVPAPLPVTVATPGLPTNWLQLYRDSAALYCPGLSWTVLAAIGEIESGHGTNDGPSSAGALGPMQFLPSTWAEWGIAGFGRTGPPDIMNPLDAVPSAAHMLCADGATQGSAGLSAAIWDYNHADWYVAEVLQLAQEYAHDYP